MSYCCGTQRGVFRNACQISVSRQQSGQMRLAASSEVKVVLRRYLPPGFNKPSSSFEYCKTYDCLHRCRGTHAHIHENFVTRSTAGLKILAAQTKGSFPLMIWANAQRPPVQRYAAPPVVYPSDVGHDLGCSAVLQPKGASDIRRTSRFRRRLQAQ